MKMRLNGCIPVISAKTLKIKEHMDVLNKYFIGCVVTKKEAKSIDIKYKYKMPKDEKFEDINADNLWSRYIESGIKDIY